MTRKPCLDTTDLFCDRNSHRPAGIDIRKLQKKDSASLLAHAGHGFFRHILRYSRVRLATDHEERTVGPLLTGSVPAEKFLYELIALPPRFEHFACELRLCFSSTGLRDALVCRQRLVFQHVAHPELRKKRLNGRRQD